MQDMKKIFIYSILSVIGLCVVSSCFQAVPGEGYLGTGIHLQGSDTLKIPIGQQVSTMSAWLDNSTRPVKFEIYDIRDKFGESKKEFFTTSEITVWNAPYDFLTDKTRELITQKLGRATVTPIMVNSVNGQIYSMPTTAQCGLDPGDIFNVDVLVSNSKGSEIIKDYAVLEFLAGTSQDKIQIEDFVNGICVETKDDEGQSVNIFPFYDPISTGRSDYSARVSNVIADNGKEENLALRKVSDEPADGVRLTVKFLDKDGNLYDPSTYSNYTTTYSLMDVSIDRVNDPASGMVVEFPTTPWPVNYEYHYMRGPYYSNTDNLDVSGVMAWAAANKEKLPESQNLSSDIFSPGHFVGWYVRLRTKIRFYDTGSYELVAKVPFTTAK